MELMQIEFENVDSIHVVKERGRCNHGNELLGSLRKLSTS